MYTAMAWRMRKLVVTRYQKVAILAFLICVTILQPLRSMVMGPFIPTTWADADTKHLYHILRDFQDIPVHSQPKERDLTWSKVQANLSQYDDYLRHAKAEYPEFWSRITTLQTETKKLKSNEELKILNTFKPSLTFTEKAQLMFAFDTFHRACEEAGLLYFILEASLMGVLRHHGPIPWDDDIDVVMNVQQWAKIRNVLGNIEGFELYTPPTSQWKFYMSIASTQKGKQFKFPFIDIFFYDEDKTHMWALTTGLKHDLLYYKADVFPLQHRPFAGNMVPVPCNLDLIVHKAHNTRKCVTPEYNHKINDFETVLSRDCSVLHHVYPFVFQEESELPGCVKEELRLGNKKIHTMTLPTGCISEGLCGS